MQSTCETPSYAHLDNASTKEVLQKNSTDSCMGRRPMYKSDEFFQSTSLVDQISLILLWSTVEQVLHLLGAGVLCTVGSIYRFLGSFS